ncbi:hypothetical protein GCM10023210_28720 [Chryseobacterium ginsengisoli]|uniref:Uncharacterized protein n=1 Tax=Chryseobacterium ginsengisoli TaxID=363853 RepID=A0ABP9MH74_9FLAO
MMEFLKQNFTKIILYFFAGVFCFGIVKQVFDPNSDKYEYFEQHFNGRVIYRSYDQMSHTYLIKSSDYKKIYIDDLDFFTLIKLGDSIVKKKNVTYLTLYKKDHCKIIYDMYDKKLRILK